MRVYLSDAHGQRTLGMTECITAEQWVIWSELMQGSLVQISDTLYRLEATTQTVLWELTHGDWCWRVEQ